MLDEDMLEKFYDGLDPEAVVVVRRTIKALTEHSDFTGHEVWLHALFLQLAKDLEDIFWGQSPQKKGLG